MTQTRTCRDVRDPCRPSGSWAPCCSPPQSTWTAAFVQRMRENGWIEGRTVAIEYRWAAGRSERFTEIAAEFARLKVDVIVTAGTDAVIAAKKATSVAQLVRQKESRPRAAPCLLSEGSSVVIGVSDRVLHVAGDIMRGALRLVDFAFRLQLLIAGYLAG
jgi:hypothetical protein